MRRRGSRGAVRETDGAVNNALKDRGPQYLLKPRIHD